MQHDAVRTEHLLLGLIKEGGGIACAVLKKAAIDLDKLREEIERRCPRGASPSPPQIPISADLKKILELSGEESRNLGHNYIGTEHILLGMLRQKEGAVGQMLFQAGLSMEQARSFTLSFLKAAASHGHTQPQGKPAKPEEASQESSGKPPSSIRLPEAFFERITQRVRKCLENAQTEALRRNHNFIGTEHLLLGMLKDESGVACSVLRKLGVEFKSIHEGVDRRSPPGDEAVQGEAGYSARALRVLQWAYREAQSMQHRFIGTEHLLLGLLKEEQSVAAQALHDLGVHYEPVREEVVKILGLEAGAASPEDKPLPSLSRREPSTKKYPPRPDSESEMPKPPPSGAKVKSDYSREATELLERIQEVEKMKQEAIKQEKFEEAGRLRDQLGELTQQVEDTLKGNHTVTFIYDDETVEAVLQLMKRYWQLKSESVGEEEITDWLKLSFFRLPEFAVARKTKKRPAPPESGEAKEGAS